MATEKGRRRQDLLFQFLDRYPMATTDQLASLIWSGDQRLARSHLLRFVREGRLRRLPHPLYRNGAYVYLSRGERVTTHSPKVLHHLAAVDFHLAVVRHLGRHGARIVPELPWGVGVTPDQTVFYRDMVWAIEHHLTGEFRHVPDYHRFMEEDTFSLCHWWRPGLRLGLLVITVPAALEHVRHQLGRHVMPGLTWRVASQESARKDPGAWLIQRVPITP